MKKIIFLIGVMLFAKNSNLDFLNTLNEVTEIATKNRLNLDRTPSNANIIKRDFILNSGAKTLIDVVRYLPGVEISYNSVGKKQIIIRGNKSSYRDKIKFLVNGIDVTNNFYSNQYYYYNFPAALIKRVEFTKTPDSVGYGDKAFLGVINLITLDELDDNIASFYGNSDGAFYGSLFQKYKDFLIDIHYGKSEADLEPRTSYLVDIQKGIFYPYRSGIEPNTLEKSIGLGIRYKKDNSLFSYRIEYFENGDFYGLENVTPVVKDKTTKTMNQYLNFNNEAELNFNWKNSFNAGVKNFSFNAEYRLFPYDFNVSKDFNPSKDMIEGAQIKEIELYAKNSLKFVNDKHTVKFLTEAKYAKPYDVYYLNYIPEQNNKKKLKGNEGILNGDVNRKVFSLGLEDLYIVNEKLVTTLGYRYDHYNDFGSSNSYKVGGVYKYKDNNIFKLLFNRAFRAPSWIELYSKTEASFNGNPDLKPETIDMSEFIWILKRDGLYRMQFSAYYGVNQNYIIRKLSATSTKRTYTNLGTYYIKGFEIAFNQNIQKFKYNISYSFNKNRADFSEKISNIDMLDYPGVRKHMIKGYGVYKIDDNLNLFLSSIYGSSMDVPHGESVKSYFTINANIKYSENDTTFLLGVENLTDRKNYEIVMPSDIFNNRYFFEKDGAQIPDNGRRIYLSVIKKW